MWYPLECLLGNAVIAPSQSLYKPDPLSSSYLVHRRLLLQFFSTTLVTDDVWPVYIRNFPANIC